MLDKRVNTEKKLLEEMKIREEIETEMDMRVQTEKKQLKKNGIREERC